MDMCQILSAFPDKPEVSPIYGGKWKRREVLSPFRFFLSPAARPITVPKGFITDYASIPRILWSWLPAWGPYGPAAIIHDYLYYMGADLIVPRIDYPLLNTICTRKNADDLFEIGMGILGVGYVKRMMIYQAVRVFGKSHYNETANGGNINAYL